MQLETARTQAEDIRLHRAQTEHAIAVLISEPATTFHLDPQPLPVEVQPPPLEIGLPSRIARAPSRRRGGGAAGRGGERQHRRRPRGVLSGVPHLGARWVREHLRVPSWITAPARLWAVGPEALLTLFDGGRRRGAD